MKNEIPVALPAFAEESRIQMAIEVAQYLL
jgi:hypothetical protein